MAQYKIQVLEIGHDTKFPAGIAFDFEHMQNEAVYSPFAMTLIQGEGHTILFDCGIDPHDPFSKEKIRMEGDQNCHDTGEVLLSIGINPADIDTVILSHCHWDHIGGIKFLPNATFYVQERELTCWEKAMADSDFPHTHKRIMNPENLLELRKYAGQGRVVYLNGDADELFPGISVKAAAGHSFCQSMLFVTSGGMRFALIGDVAMRPESFVGTESTPGFLPNLKFSVAPIWDITRSYRSVLDWVNGEISHIIPTHDGTRRDHWPTHKSELGLDVTTVCK